MKLELGLVHFFLVLPMERFAAGAASSASALKIVFFLLGLDSKRRDHLTMSFDFGLHSLQICLHPGVFRSLSTSEFAFVGNFGLGSDVKV